MISIIGSGKVGAAIAFLMASNSLDDLVLINHTKNKAIGEALDISNSIPLDSSHSVIGTDDFSKMKNSKIIIISARYMPRSYTTISNEPRQSVTNTITQINMLREITKKNSEIFSYTNCSNGFKSC